MPYYIFSECTEPSETETDEGNTVYVYCIHILHIYMIITSIKKSTNEADRFLFTWLVFEIWAKVFERPNFESTVVNSLRCGWY